MDCATDAGYRSRNREGCLKGTRKGVLQEIEHWMTSEQDQHTFWLNGLAGTGKSTIAQTFAEMAFADGMLGASFFCSRDFQNRSNLQMIFPTLAFQLAYQYPAFRKELLQVLKAHPNVGQESLCSQMEELIVGPLKATHIPTLIIIDALDECKDEEPASAILSVLSRYVNKIPNIKFFITGRPEPRIRSGFRLRSLVPITEVLKLHEVQPEVVNNDIKLFFQTRLTDLAERRGDCGPAGDWPSSSDIEILCKKAAGFFIYASTVIKFVTFKNHKPTKRLNQIISLPESTSHEGGSGIDLLYTQVLEQAVNDMDMDDEELHSHFRTIVAAVLLLFNPLPIKALSDLLRDSDISTTLYPLHSLLLIPDTMKDPILTFHKSFPDFLMDPKRCTDQRFLVEPAVHHAEITLSCLNLMKDRLKRNICKLDDFAVLSKVEDLSVHKKEYIGDALEYACHFWTKHLLRIPGGSPHVEEVEKVIDDFFTSYLIFWIEVLSLTGNLDIGVYALNDIWQWYMLVSDVEYPFRKPMLTFVQVGIPYKWGNDGQRLLLESFDAISTSPSWIYNHALPFCPSSSWLHKCYSPELLQVPKVVKGLPAEWGTCSRTVLFDPHPYRLACWKDIIVVGLGSGDIPILDGITGSQVAVLSGHTREVSCLTLSLDGKLLVSGSDDWTVKLWDVQTGGVINTFHGHTNIVLSTSISPDSTMIASGSVDSTIHLWDVQTRECLQIIEQQARVNHVIFSPADPQHLISISEKQVWKWDINGHQISPPYGQSCVVFSSDGTKFVSCQGGAVVVQNSDSQTIVAKFHTTAGDIYYCSFSPNGRLMAIAVNSTICVWDITSSDPCIIETFVGHTKNISCLAFSSHSSLISSSGDNSIKFWQIGTSPSDPAMIDLQSTSLVLAPIMSITLQTKDGIVISCDGDGVVRTWGILTGLNNLSFQTPAKDYHNGDVRLVDSRLIFVWQVDREVHIWDVEKGELIQMVNIPDGNVEDVRISGDGSKVFCLHYTSIQAWSTWTGEAMGEVGLEYSKPRRSLTVDGTRVWVHSPVLELQGWDFGTPDSSPIQLSDISLPYLNSTKLWDIHQSRIKDTVTGNVVFQLGERFAEPVDSQWDGQYLVCGYESGEVLIVDFSNTLPNKDR